MQSRKSKLELKSESSADELVISSSGNGNGNVWEEGTILASNSRGSSLTLLEEYARRKKENYTVTFLLSFACAAASLTFTYLIFLKL